MDADASVGMAFAASSRTPPALIPRTLSAGSMIRSASAAFFASVAPIANARRSVVSIGGTAPNAARSAAEMGRTSSEKPAMVMRPSSSRMLAMRLAISAAGFGAQFP